MKNFENSLSRDTVLNTGLLAIAIAWVALAAIRGPVATDDAATHAARPVGIEAPAMAGARSVNAPASGLGGEHKQVS